MANGWGEAVGVGAEAASGAFQQTLNYKVALGLQQLRVGIEKEKLAMDKERQALEMERIQDTLDRSAIEQKTLKLDYETKLAQSQIRAEAEKTIKAGEFVGPSPTGTAPSAQRVTQAYATVGREPTARMEEAALTPFELRKRDAELRSLEAGISSTQALAINRLREDMPNVSWGKQKTDARLEISKLYNNIVFTAMPEWKQKYPSAQSWFDQVILGGTTQPSAAGGNVSSQIQELKGYGYTLEILKDETVTRELKADGFDMDNIKANWDAE